MANASKSKAKTAGSAPAKKNPKKKTPSIEFQLLAPDAKEVFLVGDFNDWDPTMYKMRKFKGDVFKKKLPLKTGRYEYKFVVDGEWWTDPANSEKQPTSFGAENSVITIP